MAAYKLVFVFCFLFNVLVLAYSQSNVLKWEAASTVPTNQLIPAGKQDNFTYYVARGTLDSHWLNGKSMFIRLEHIAYFPYLGREYESKNFQVLTGPSTTISWVVARLWNLPDYWIAGGTDPTSEETSFICRAWHGRHLIVGRGLQSVGVCYVGIDNRVYEYDIYEVLVLNAYGVATGAAPVPDVPGPVFVESQDSDINFEIPVRLHGSLSPN